MSFSPFGLLRRERPHTLAVSVVGVKLGDRLLQIGADRPGLFAALAAKVGLTGHAAVADDRSEMADRLHAALAAEGALADLHITPLGRLPYEDGAFDLVVVARAVGQLRPEERVRCLQEAFRVLRSGGRCVLLEPARRGGLGALLRSAAIDPDYEARGGAEAAMSAEGFVGVRRIAERDGTAYFEGGRAR